MRALYAKGARVAEIMERFKRSESAVERAVYGAGLKRPGPRWRHRPEREAALTARNAMIRGLRQAGHSIREIAIEVGLSIRRINEILGTPRRKKASTPTPQVPLVGQLAPLRKPPAKLTRPQQTQRDRFIRRWYAAGVSIAQLARRYGITKHAVRRVLDAK